ncbi:DUF4190 domain-containing protein [Arthrobacter crystallopoietes]|uniref:DUF4190 domain-containing protein n=1 Tax=Crystallibacter crystallopoietes TaxID=37928 RepID=A0A1H1B5Z4_9MICC|nr:DUF4190 domain-containing protein [Arthrobacter crystallopoietes]AUI51267.1 hypothetical protein AC20117_11060 [Arthrobacter crystallopoietes]SDQ47375.1 hypothetical protein SAMN04489742_1259 [Arthrobacter crystallopoietes]
MSNQSPENPSNQPQEGAGESAANYPSNQPYGQAPQQNSPYGQYPDQGGYGYQAPMQEKKGLAITALVLGIVALVLGVIPGIGFLSFILGPLAIVFGIIALVKKQRKGMSITGIVLGALGVIAAIVITAIIAMFFQQAVGEHTVQYKVTSEGPATVMYFDGVQPVEEQIEGDWDEEISFTGLPFGAVTVTSEGGTVTCEVIMDGQSVVTNSGSGQVECASGDEFVQ